MFAALSLYYAFNLFQINFFPHGLRLISKGWNLFFRLCGTITNSQLLFAHNRFKSSLSWPLKVSIIIKECWFSGYPSSFFLTEKYGKIITLNRSSHFSKLDQCFGVNVTRKLEKNVNFGKHIFDLPWAYLNQLNRQRGTCSRTYKSHFQLPFVIRLFNENIFWPLWWK